MSKKISIDVALTMFMPYGKYEGKQLDDLPSKYLLWVAENWDNDRIASAADAVWRWREATGSHE